MSEEIKNQIIMYGADWCPDCRRAKAFLDGHGIHYQFIDVDKFPWATEVVQQINNGKRIIPTILIDDTAYSKSNNAIFQHSIIPVAERSGAKFLNTTIYTCE